MHLANHMTATPIPSHIKTSHAYAKGFDLYALRNGVAAARLCSYGQLSHVGFLFYFMDFTRLEIELNRKPM